MKLNINKSNWKKVKLGHVAFEYSDRISNPSNSKLSRFVGSKNIAQWDFTVKTWESTSSVTSAMKLFKANDYLLVRRSLYASDFRERSPRADFSGVCSGDILTIRENHEFIHDGYLIAVLNSPSFWQYIVANGSGSITRRVKWKELANYEFLLPPKPQQAQIAELLWAADSTIEKQIEVLNNLELLLYTTFKERCSQATTLKEYQIVNLLTEGPKNGISPKINSDTYGYKTVSIGAIKNGVFAPEGNIKYATVSEDVLRKFDVQASDIFVVRGNGNKTLCGRAGLATKAYPGLFYPDLLIRLRFAKDLILPEFAVFLWNSMSNHQNLLKWAKSTNGIWKINGDDIKRHKLAIPLVADQQQIMNELANIYPQISYCKINIANTKQLLKSIINNVL